MKPFVCYPPLPLVLYWESGVTGFLPANEYYMCRKRANIFQILSFTTLVSSSPYLRGMNSLSSHILSKSARNWFENRAAKGTSNP